MGIPSTAQEHSSPGKWEIISGPGTAVVPRDEGNTGIDWPASAAARRSAGPPDRAAAQQQGFPQAVPAGFRWKSALLQSGFLLGLQHGFRMFEIETRRELDGPFFKDYVDSVRGLQGWGDGDTWVTNYVAHPLMGATSGYIQVHNDPGGMGLEFGKDPAYWKSRLKAMGWAAAYSLQFELGPAGEAGIGNVGLRPGTMGFVDLVVTPLGGFGLMILEDFLDRRVICKLEAGTSSRNARGFYRIALNPTRSLANFLRLQHIYHRDTR
jgi:hypothetical protein